MNGLGKRRSEQNRRDRKAEDREMAAFFAATARDFGDDRWNPGDPEMTQAL